MENYTRINKLGRGTYGDVILAQRNSDNKKFAIKRVFVESEEAKEINTEIAVLKSLNHPNIVKYYDSFVKAGKLYIVMDYADSGDLQKRLKEAKTLEENIPEEKILSWFCQLCLALKHIHSKKIMHRDLKSQNVFLASLNEIKLGDFGISKILDYTGDFAKTSLGTPYYLSPEICSGFKYNIKSDTWMLGTLLYELCTLRKPFLGDSLHIVMKNIMKSPYIPLPKCYSETIHFVVKSLLEKNPNLRASIDDILIIPLIAKRVKEIQMDEKYENSRVDLESLMSGRDKICFPIPISLLNPKTPELSSNITKIEVLKTEHNQQRALKTEEYYYEEEGNSEDEMKLPEKINFGEETFEEDLKKDIDESVVVQDISLTHKMNKIAPIKTTPPDKKLNSGGRLIQNSQRNLNSLENHDSSKLTFKKISHSKEEKLNKNGIVPNQEKKFEKMNSGKENDIETVENKKLEEESERSEKKEERETQDKEGNISKDSSELNETSVGKNNNSFSFNKKKLSIDQIDDLGSDCTLKPRENILSLNPKRNMSYFQQDEYQNSRELIHLSHNHPFSQHHSNHTQHKHCASPPPSAHTEFESFSPSKLERFNPASKIPLRVLHTEEPTSQNKISPSNASHPFTDLSRVSSHYSRPSAPMQRLYSQGSFTFFHSIQEDEKEDSPNKFIQKSSSVHESQGFPLETKHFTPAVHLNLNEKCKKTYHHKPMTINTSFDPPTPVGQGLKEKSASTKSHYRIKKANPSQQTSISAASSTTARPQHFIFSETLFNQGLSSPNRPFLFTDFLIQKLGENKFEKAKNFLLQCSNPLRMLESANTKMIEIIGEENKQFLQVFKYILNSNSTPLNAHSHSRTRSLQTPETMHKFKSPIQHFPPYQKHPPPLQCSHIPLSYTRLRQLYPSALSSVSPAAIPTHVQNPHHSNHFIINANTCAGSGANVKTNQNVSANCCGNGAYAGIGFANGSSKSNSGSSPVSANSNSQCTSTTSSRSATPSSYAGGPTVLRGFDPIPEHPPQEPEKQSHIPLSNVKIRLKPLQRDQTDK